MIQKCTLVPWQCFLSCCSTFKGSALKRRHCELQEPYTEPYLQERHEFASENLIALKNQLNRCSATSFTLTISRNNVLWQV